MTYYPKTVHAHDMLCVGTVSYTSRNISFGFDSTMSVIYYESYYLVVALASSKINPGKTVRYCHDYHCLLCPSGHQGRLRELLRCCELVNRRRRVFQGNDDECVEIVDVYCHIVPRRRRPN